MSDTVIRFSEREVDLMAIVLAAAVDELDGFSPDELKVLTDLRDLLDEHIASRRAE